MLDAVVESGIYRLTCTQGAGSQHLSPSATAVTATEADAGAAGTSGEREGGATVTDEVQEQELQTEEVTNGTEVIERSRRRGGKTPMPRGVGIQEVCKGPTTRIVSKGFGRLTLSTPTHGRPLLST